MWSDIYGKPRVAVPKEVQVGVVRCAGCGGPAVAEFCGECSAKDAGTWD